MLEPNMPKLLWYNVNDFLYLMIFQFPPTFEQPNLSIISPAKIEYYISTKYGDACRSKTKSFYP